MSYKLQTAEKELMKWQLKTKRKLVGLKCLRGFRQGCNQLSLRTPEGCTLSRATFFNRHKTTSQFFLPKSIENLH